MALYHPGFLRIAARDYEARSTVHGPSRCLPWKIVLTPDYNLRTGQSPPLNRGLEQASDMSRSFLSSPSRLLVHPIQNTFRTGRSLHPVTPRLVRSGEVEPLLVNRRKFDFRAFLLVGRTAPTVSHAPFVLKFPKPTITDHWSRLALAEEKSSSDHKC